MSILTLKRMTALALCGGLLLGGGEFARADDAKPEAKPAAKAPTKIERPLLWMVERTPPVFLYGTIHLPDTRVTNLPEVVAAAIDGSSAMRTEIKMDMMTIMQAQGLIMREGSQKPGATLKEELGDELYARVEKAVRHPLMKMQLPSSKCWRAWMIVSSDSVLRKYGQALPLDKQLWDRAAKAGKDVDGIETVQEQIGPILSLKPEQHKQLLVTTLDDLQKATEGGEGPLDKLLNAYLRGDAEAIQAMMAQVKQGDDTNAQLLDLLLTKRNQKMAERTLTWMKANPTKSMVLAVGAAHMPGPDGLVKLLQKAGHKVTRLGLADTDKVKKALAAPVAAPTKAPTTTGG